jgi:hypothetical protein
MAECFQKRTVRPLTGKTTRIELLRNHHVFLSACILRLKNPAVISGRTPSLLIGHLLVFYDFLIFGVETTIIPSPLRLE